MRVQLLISNEEMELLDQWRAEHKIWSRSDAIRKLIKLGVSVPLEGIRTVNGKPVEVLKFITVDDGQ